MMQNEITRHPNIFPHPSSLLLASLQNVVISHLEVCVWFAQSKTIGGKSHLSKNNIENRLFH
jgi:hypothetical protein